MATYSLKEIAKHYGCPHTTTWAHVQELKRKKKFKKTSPGQYYNERELSELEKLLEFKFPR